MLAGNINESDAKIDITIDDNIWIIKYHLYFMYHSLIF